MARMLKPMHVETYTDHRKDVTVELMFDRNEKTFFAEVQLEKLEAESIHELRAKVQEKVASWRPLQWRRVIELQLSQPDETRPWMARHESKRHFEVTLEFEFQRLELAESMKGGIMGRPFEEDLDEAEQERQREAPLAYVESVGSWRAERQIPYSDEAWATLLSLKDVMEHARGKLKELFDIKNGGKRLAAFSGPALLLQAKGGR